MARTRFKTSRIVNSPVVSFLTRIPKEVVLIRYNSWSGGSLSVERLNFKRIARGCNLDVYRGAGCARRSPATSLCPYPEIICSRNHRSCRTSSTSSPPSLFDTWPELTSRIARSTEVIFKLRSREHRASRTPRDSTGNVPLRIVLRRNSKLLNGGADGYSRVRVESLLGLMFFCLLKQKRCGE